MGGDGVVEVACLTALRVQPVCHVQMSAVSSHIGRGGRHVAEEGPATRVYHTRVAPLHSGCGLRQNRDSNSVGEARGVATAMPTAASMDSAEWNDTRAFEAAARAGVCIPFPRNRL